MDHLPYLAYVERDASIPHIIDIFSRFCGAVNCFLHLVFYTLSETYLFMILYGMRPMTSLSRTHSGYCVHKYDCLAEKSEYFAPEIALGLMIEYVTPEDILLDVGIGTGLSSKGFCRMGVEVVGLDSSQDMLSQCRKKGIHNIIEGDINCFFPFKDETFDHVLSVGVFHFFRSLTHIFSESHRVIKDRGIYGFTVMDPGEGPDIIERSIEGIGVYLHSQDYTEGLLDIHGFTVLKKAKFLSYTGPSKDQEITYSLFIARKRGENNRTGIR